MKFGRIDFDHIMINIAKTASLTLSLLIVLHSPLLIENACSQSPGYTLPERQHIRVRQPGQFRQARLPDVQAPITYSDAFVESEELISLDDAIRIAMENAEVVRIITGVAASTSGRTIYDVAVTNTTIDDSAAVFDPTFDITSTMNKSDRPGVGFDPIIPGVSRILGSSTDSINTAIGLNKRNYNGAQLGVNVNTIGSYFEPGIAPLEPDIRSSLEVTFRQPLMRGYGQAANLTPVILARNQTERSFFQLKSSVQELVRSVIEAYWSLVAARIDIWAREQQIEQLNFALKRATARQEEGFDQVSNVAQARSALANFQAGLISAKSNLLLRETALRNVFGLPFSNTSKYVPSSVPIRERVDLNWDELLMLAERHRPDIIELKLILEADEQRRAQASNQARPQLDAIANYRWDGVEGTMPNGATLRSPAGRFQGFNIGVNFSVPIGLRQSRAALRRQDLILNRDRINLDQAIHQMVHQIAINYRNVDQFFAQIEAFQRAKEASRLNLENQLGDFLSGRAEFIVVLQAISDWGNAVSQEAQSITQYNIELANIELQSGTILETHGIVFYEERFQAIGPMGRLGNPRCYPAKTIPSENIERYPGSGSPSDKAFDLRALPEYDGGSSRPPDNFDGGGN